MIKGLILAATLTTCAVVPSTGEVIRGPFADCRAAALEVRFQLTEAATSTGELSDEYQAKLRDFAAAQAEALQPCADTAQETGATIGGTIVPPGLHCQEDEVIAFHGVPDDLACVHIDSFREGS